MAARPSGAPPASRSFTCRELALLATLALVQFVYFAAAAACVATLAAATTRRSLRVGVDGARPGLT
ncbi:MAG TPA: hypothetical protein VMS76_14405 [Planctomycetota bacterium]|nr:hypothetical protein [Planctomycetota bacterium]